LDKRNVYLLILIIISSCLVSPIPSSNARSSVEVEVTEDGYVDEGAFVLFNATTTYRCTIVGDDENWYVEFNISDIHENATIDHIRYKYTSNDGGGNTIIYGFESIIQPSQAVDNAANNQKIFDDAENGTAYVTAHIPMGVNVTNVIELGAQAVIDLQDAIDNGRDYFVIGAHGGGASVDDIWAVDSGVVANYSMLYVDWHLDTDYIYQFTDTYYENGTYYVPPVEVTAVGDGFSETFNTSGGTTQYYPTEPVFFYWDLGSGYSRYIYSYGSANYTVTMPESTYGVYAFEIRDYPGAIGQNDCYLEALRTINGTLTLIENNIIINTLMSTPLHLVQNQLYYLRIRLASGEYYNIGWFVASADLTPTLVVTGVGFDDQYQPTAAYINIEIDRPNATHIRVLYNDTLADYPTLNVTMQIEYRNDTLVYMDNATGEDLAFHWYAAVNTTAYRVRVTVDHSYYGNITKVIILDGVWEPPDPLDFSFIGLPSTLFSVFIVMVFLGGVSRYSASLGVFVATLIGVGLHTWGWWVMPIEVQAAGVIIAVFMKVSGRG